MNQFALSIHRASLGEASTKNLMYFIRTVADDFREVEKTIGVPQIEQFLICSM
jgi:hypothetical protein